MASTFRPELAYASFLIKSRIQRADADCCIDDTLHTTSTLQTMCTAADDENSIVSECATFTCGEESDDLETGTTTACSEQVTCQEEDEHHHEEEESKKQTTEISDEALFQEPSPRAECPICMQTLPINPAEQKYQPCCGKMLCMGCIYAVLKRGNNILLCPFCRAPEATSDGEAVERIMKRVEADDAVAIHTLGCCHDAGERGMQQDYEKAVELWLRAGELGCAKSYNNVGGCYFRGEGVERDTMKARYYLKLAAMGGSVYARHNLGILEENAGNINKAMMHWMIAARSGYDTSLYKVQGGFNGGHIMADDYEEVVHSHEESKDEMKSDQRDAAAAWIASNRNRSILPSFTKKLCCLCSLMNKMVDYIFELHGM